MRKPWSEALVRFGVRHPVLLVIAVIALVSVCTVLFLSSTKGQAVLYQAF